MSSSGEGMDRRNTMESTPATGEALGAFTSVDGPSWGSPGGGDLADCSIQELIRMIRRKEITSRRLVEAYLERIRKYGGRDGVNAYIELAGQAALERAEELDEYSGRNRFVGPLHGLPIAVKDNLDTSGIRTTGGSKILATWTPPEDAFVIKMLKRSGAIILGKTNMHEFALGVTTNNLHYGPTRNPYDPTRISGGSSGGSAAAVSAGLCAAAIGTDTGGSIRIPAALCGVVGLKPTLGRVGRGGLMSLSSSRDVIGPISRTVADAALIMEAISGHDPTDPESVSKPVPRYSRYLTRRSLKGKKFGIPRKYFFDLIDADTEKVINGAVAQMKDMGAIVREVEVKHMDIATPTGFNIVLAECVFLLESYLRRFDPEASIGKYLDQLCLDVKGILGGQVGTPECAPVPGHLYVKSIREERSKMISGFTEAMHGLDALLLPTTPMPACTIGKDRQMEGPVTTELSGEKVDVFLTYIRNCDPVSVVGYPAISVPAGYSAAGLPIGLQIVARPWGEPDLIGMAHVFESAVKVGKPDLRAFES